MPANLTAAYGALLHTSLLLTLVMHEVLARLRLLGGRYDVYLEQLHTRASTSADRKW